MEVEENEKKTCTSWHTGCGPVRRFFPPVSTATAARTDKTPPAARPSVFPVQKPKTGYFSLLHAERVDNGTPSSSHAGR